MRTNVPLPSSKVFAGLALPPVCRHSPSRAPSHPLLHFIRRGLLAPTLGERTHAQAVPTHARQQTPHVTTLIFPAPVAPWYSANSFTHPLSVPVSMPCRLLPVPADPFFYHVTLPRARGHQAAGVSTGNGGQDVRRAGPAERLPRGFLAAEWTVLQNRDTDSATEMSEWFDQHHVRSASGEMPTDWAEPFGGRNTSPRPARPPH